MLQLCLLLSERIHISTPNRYEYQFVKKPAAMEYLTFLVKAKNDATIALARNHDAHELYEIVLGGWDNSPAQFNEISFHNSLSLIIVGAILSRYLIKKIFTKNNAKT